MIRKIDINLTKVNSILEKIRTINSNRVLNGVMVEYQYKNTYKLKQYARSWSENEKHGSY